MPAQRVAVLPDRPTVRSAVRPRRDRYPAKPGRSDPTHEITQEQYRSLRSRDSRTTLTVNRASFSVETTDYQGWDSFRSLLSRVLE